MGYHLRLPWCSDGNIYYMHYSISLCGGLWHLSRPQKRMYYGMKKHPDISQFYKRRFTKILIPYFLVSIPALCWNDLFFEKTGIKAFFSDIFFYSFFTRGMAWFWYILLICFCYLIFPFIFRVLDKAPDEESEQIKAFSAISIWLYYVFHFSVLVALLVNTPMKSALYPMVHMV